MYGQEVNLPKPDGLPRASRTISMTQRLERRPGAGRASSRARTAPAGPSRRVGQRVFHQFGYGRVLEADGNKLATAFEKVGEKKPVASFVKPV